ncbi:PfkB family carbohydrate kinase [Paucibacter sp. DJ2R-2]|uniref:PfkB family carbohydrate kinase n=1 Tax=Paucibacter sp. DJ2R-2 TaxID=2893558 RepID=UPI0021E3B297|nr:PfkB family carbohydrate kinase [Paucibacter sp. DJ2R-2]MCV2421170.1 PfkB family carbohydrate kinase [Paucibacter sp. DJ4R-1]MCV2439148.1 PfkB family carbohydrate kinase [Paucibacter sp. DJ2R-2]
MQQPSSAVLLVGEALVDEFHERQVAGGAPFNLARSLGALLADGPGSQAPVCFVSRIGHGDAGGALIRTSLQRFGLATEGVQIDPTHATGRVTVSEQFAADGSPAGHSFHIHTPAAWDFIASEPALASLEALRPRFLYFGTLAQRGAVSGASIQALAKQARSLGCTRYLDLNLRAGTDTPELAAASLAQADWLKVNDEELGLLFRWFGRVGDAALNPLGDAQALSSAVATLMQRFGLQRLILTRGSAGYAAFAADGELLAQGSGLAIAQLVDTVGAGDAFSAMLLASQMGGHALPDSLQLANRYAAALCGERGPMPEDDAFFLPWRQALQQQTLTENAS